MKNPKVCPYYKAAVVSGCLTDPSFSLEGLKNLSKCDITSEIIACDGSSCGMYPLCQGKTIEGLGEAIKGFVPGL